ncbi:unnamed protein product [Leptidea sinapis]|uniref:Uncharacterized protein n=1 Tax=Leptidea sinapis TaxID=189913 RepID=A0A5E4QW79_9NEOP|nr:unnamed protein product [Leptidea sinapis]
MLRTGEEISLPESSDLPEYYDEEYLNEDNMQDERRTKQGCKVGEVEQTQVNEPQDPIVQGRKRGRPRKRKGGHRTTDKTSTDQVHEANQKYRMTHRTVDGQLEVNNDMKMPLMYSMECKASVPSEDIKNKPEIMTREQKAEHRRKYNAEKKRLSRSKEDIRMRETIRNRLSKRIERSHMTPRQRQMERDRNTAARRRLREDPAYREKERLRNSAARRRSRQDPAYREKEQARNTAARRRIRQKEQARKTAISMLQGHQVFGDIVINVETQ